MKINSLQTIEFLLFKRFANDKIKAVNGILPSMISSLQRATDRILESRRNFEMITVIGGYDADSVIGCAILCSALEASNIAHQIIFPDRLSGYGITTSVVDSVEGGIVITVANGTNALEAAKRAGERGLTLIVTDNQPLRGNEMPPAFAIVNPELQEGCELKGICGAGVAWLLASSLRRGADSQNDLDLLSIATLSSVVEFSGANRILARFGLGVLNSSKRACVEALRYSLNVKKFGYGDLVEQIAPIINAAGKVATAKAAFDFLRSSTIEQALDRYTQLDAFARERKVVDDKWYEKALTEIDISKNAIILSGDWQEEISGSVASRLARRFRKPVVLISSASGVGKAQLGDRYGGDLRTLLGKCGEELVEFDGGKTAATLKVRGDRIKQFEESFLEAVSKHTQDLPEGYLGELDLKLVTPDLKEFIERFEPFGDNNPEPVFYAEDIRVRGIRFQDDEESGHLEFIFPHDIEAEYRNPPKKDYKDLVSFYYTLKFYESDGERKVLLNILRIREF
jgi:single-stranded-DNA-specific exonuclease